MVGRAISTGASAAALIDAVMAIKAKVSSPKKPCRNKERRDFQRKARARDKYPILFRIYALSSFTYSLLGILMLTIFRDIPENFREHCLINLDLFAILLVVQGPVSFWADVIEEFIELRKGLGRSVDAVLAPTLTFLAIAGSMYWGSLLRPEEMHLAMALFSGPAIFILDQ